jgi:small nuclear ribonucleoprotein
MSDRPIDVLDKSKGKKIIIKLKNGEEMNGVLRALDLHLNLWLDEAEVSKNGGENKLKIGTVLVRGDTIVYASPAQV